MAKAKKAKRAAKEIMVTVIKLADKLQEIKVKVGSTVAECLDTAGVKLVPSVKAKSVNLKVRVGNGVTKDVDFDYVVKKNDTYISLMMEKIKGGK